MGISRPARMLEWTISGLMITYNTLQVMAVTVDSFIFLLDKEREHQLSFNEALNNLTKDIETLEDTDGR